MDSLALHASGLGKRFGEHVVLDGITFDLAAGSVLGYVGGNGAGKTTTFRIVAGLTREFEGEVVVVGHDVRRDPESAKRLVGYLPERPALFETLTVAETLLFCGRLHGLDDATVRKRGEALLDAFDMAGAVGMRVGTLSKGMRQKVALTSTLLHAPRLLVLDEPLSGLDVPSTLTVRALLRGLASRRCAVLVSSHVMSHLETLCDEVAILHDARLIDRGPPSDVAARLRAGSLEELVGTLSGPTDDDRAERLRRVFEAFAP